MKRKSTAQLEREIAEILQPRPIDRTKRIFSVSRWRDGQGRRGHKVTYEDGLSHEITRDDYNAEAKRLRLEQARYS